MSERFALLLRQDLAELEAAATAWRRLAAHCEEAGQQHRARITAPLAGPAWQGGHADLGRRELERTEQRLDTIRTDAAAVASTLDTVHDRMCRAQRKLRATVSAAESSGFRVDEEGMAAPIAESEQWQAALDAAVAEAETVNDEAAHALGCLGGEYLTRPQPFGGTGNAGDASAATELLGLERDHVGTADGLPSAGPDTVRHHRAALLPGSDGVDRAHRLTRGAPPLRAASLATVTRDLHRHSSTVYAALAVNGRTGQNDRIHFTRCSADSEVRDAVHAWQLDDLRRTDLDAAITRAHTRLLAQGWINAALLQPGSEARAHHPREPYTVQLLAFSDLHRIAVSVSTPPFLVIGQPTPPP